jgi:hypothetical protein
MKAGNMRARFFASALFLVTALLPFSGCDHAPPVDGKDEKKKTGADVKMEEKQYEYREDLKRLVGVTIGKATYLGHLNAAGTFVPLPGYKPTGPGGSGPGYDLINGVGIRKDTEPVYEFRSGILIKGKLDGDHNFVPEIGSTIISIKDYRYSKDALRIYNLPGTFVEKTDPKKK